MLRVRATIAIAAVLILGACTRGGDDALTPTTAPLSLAETMIIDDLAPTVGLGPLVANCDDPGVYTLQTAFACTATTGTGQVINVHAGVAADGRLSLATTNLISAAALPAYEREVAATLNNNVGSNFPAESVDCGTVAIVLPPELTLTCALIMPSSSEVFDVTLTITDIEGKIFGLKVADAPRSAVSADPAAPVESE